LTKSIFQEKKIDFLHFDVKYLKGLGFLGRTALRLEHPAGGWGILEQFAGRTDGPGHQIAPAIGTDAAKLLLGTGGAEGAFIGADACLTAFRRQVLVAALAAWSQFQHRSLL
jgi:hypothetical protein